MKDFIQPTVVGERLQCRTEPNLLKQKADGFFFLFFFFKLLGELVENSW